MIKPIYGDCLGMQMLFTESESLVIFNLLNLIKGKVKRMIPKLPQESKLPHISWNNLYNLMKKKMERNTFGI